MGGVPRNVKIKNNYLLEDKETKSKADIKWVGCCNRVALVANCFGLITQIAIKLQKHSLLFFSIIHTYVHLQETPTQKGRGDDFRIVFIGKLFQRPTQT